MRLLGKQRSLLHMPSQGQIKHYLVTPASTAVRLPSSMFRDLTLLQTNCCNVHVKNGEVVAIPAKWFENKLEY